MFMSTKLLSPWLYKNNIKIKKMSTSKVPSTAFSKMESAFIASSTLKRNKRYLDIEKLKGQEENQHLRRRKPRATSQSVDAKINRSFSNSTAALTERLDKEIGKFRSRFNSHERPATARSFYVQEADKSPRKVKGVGIDQHITREQYYKVRSKPILDQRLFNNYKTQVPDRAHTADLGNGPQRNFDNSLKHINIDIEYNTQKLYQDYYYKKSTMDCRFHYKKQREDEERYYFIPQREENKPATDLSPKNIKKSADYVKKGTTIDNFYMNSGRQLPTQLEQRSGTTLTSHWRNRENIIERPFPEYSVRSLKDRLCDERKEKISQSKKAHFERGEVCDRKFFLINGKGY